MKNKLFLFGMLVMVLAFGMMVVGCDNDDNGDFDIINPFVGTWTFRSSETGTRITSATFTFYADGKLKYTIIYYGGGPDTRDGTYTYSGDSARIDIKSGYGTITTETVTIIGGKFTYSNLLYTKQQ